MFEYRREIQGQTRASKDRKLKLSQTPERNLYHSLLSDRKQSSILEILKEKCARCLWKYLAFFYLMSEK